ncbi:uncharacterized protein [Rutidosis leptorrhynchoides]|uniref:uncharacterized protein n=1 Tax=Rutidosis leptorrhynchoides TaxID=125765 RepID=UPI003A99E355
MDIGKVIINYPQEPVPPHFTYIHKKRDAIGLLGFNVFQKWTSLIQQLAYGNAPDLFDEYLHMAKQSCYDCSDNFCKCVFTFYASIYGQKSNAHDVQRLISKHQELYGFSGMLGRLYALGLKKMSYCLERTYTRGSNNDVNVLNLSDKFDSLKQDRAPHSNFMVHGYNFNKDYYLGDGIYPDWATIVKSFIITPNPKSSKFKKYQESARKDTERAFGVLQGRFAIIKNLVKLFYKQKNPSY